MQQETFDTLFNKSMKGLFKKDSMVFVSLIYYDAETILLNLVYWTKDSNSIQRKP